jgi:hypothetical protein
MVALTEHQHGRQAVSTWYRTAEVQASLEKANNNIILFLFQKCDFGIIVLISIQST